MYRKSKSMDGNNTPKPNPISELNDLAKSLGFTEDQSMQDIRKDMIFTDSPEERMELDTKYSGLAMLHIQKHIDDELSRYRVGFAIIRSVMEKKMGFEEAFRSTLEDDAIFVAEKEGMVEVAQKLRQFLKDN